MRYFLEIAYRGTNYAGWQKQNNAPSIQAEIEKALQVILKEEIAITGSGRTDTGVHASQQFAHFDTSHTIQTGIGRSLNAILPKDISILGVYEVGKEAHSRFDAISRKYRYKIIHEKNPFLEHLATLVPYKLDVSLMQEAAHKLLLYTDYESFSKVKAHTKHFRCKINQANWYYSKDIFSQTEVLIFEITANRFLWGMVRAIVGTLLEVGRKKLSIQDFEEVIVARNRAKAAGAALPEGLYLSEIKYPYSLDSLKRH
ncbi:MAG: tRNA pseudouridine(38-40) synthase TruA [Raineya sp.]